MTLFDSMAGLGELVCQSVIWQDPATPHFAGRGSAIGNASSSKDFGTEIESSLLRRRKCSLCVCCVIIILLLVFILSK